MLEKSSFQPEPNKEDAEVQTINQEELNSPGSEILFDEDITNTRRKFNKKKNNLIHGSRKMSAFKFSKLTVNSEEIQISVLPFT